MLMQNLIDPYNITIYVTYRLVNVLELVIC